MGENIEVEKVTGEPVGIKVEQRHAMPWCESCRKHHREGKQFCDPSKNFAPASRMAILEEREKTHGDFLLVSKVAQNIKVAYQWAPNEQKLYVKEALDLIATKIARIVCGTALEPDHWEDIQGYAGLVLEQIQKQKA